MTQPIRLKVSTTSSMAEKPPPTTLNMREVAKQIFCRCIPCIRLKNKDEKLLLTRNGAASTDYDN